MDNDHDLREILQAVLIIEGFIVTAMPLMNNICLIITACHPDLILIDYSLNSLTGGRLCELVKSDKETENLPVIIMSTNANNLLKVGSHGCDDFIAKPFDLYDLIKRIKALITIPAKLHNVIDHDC